MYNILIVDDEKMICEGIRKSIDWDQLEIETAFVAFSGTEALSVIAKNKINIVITDINMSGMTGLELISTIRQQNSSIRILVLTGYDRFDYARDCLRMSVADFLLKPVDETVLAGVVRNQVQILDHQSKNMVHQRKQSLADQLEIEQLVTDLLHRHSRTETDYPKLFSKYRFDPDVTLQVALLLPGESIMSGPKTDRISAEAIRNICILLVDAQSAGISVIDTDGKVVVTFFIGVGNETLDAELEKLTKILKTEYNYLPKIIVGTPVSGYENLHLSYNDAVWKMEKEQNSIRTLLNSGIPRQKTNTFRAAYEELKIKIGDAVDNQPRIMQLYEVFRQAVGTFSLSSDDVDKCCFDLVSYAYFCSLGISSSMTDKMLHKLGQMLAHAEKDDALDITQSWLLKLYGEDDDEAHGIVAKAKAYIDAELETNLSVTNLADRLCVTPNYFSRLFRRHTGEGCNEYIVRKRLEKAQLLLTETNLPAGKIALSVGYNDINYFSLAFKKFTGLSPTKYRKAARSQR
jgi:two-component system response regulator YesN